MSMPALSPASLPSRSPASSSASLLIPSPKSWLRAAASPRSSHSQSHGRIAARRAAALLSALSSLAAPLALTALLGGCGDDLPGEPELVDVTLPFAFEIGGRPFSCGASYDGLGTTATSYTITDARFFVHGVELIDTRGGLHPLALTDGPFQGQGVALLDFESGCGDDGTTALHTALTGAAPDLRYRGVRFTLGLPPEQNFVDLAAAAAPLDVTGMFWIWQFGYKFLKVDGMARTAETAQPAPAAAPFFVHLGANGCPGTNIGAPPTGPCVNPNQVTYELALDPAFEPATSAIVPTLVADLAPVLAASNLEVNMPGTPPGCMSDPKDNECAAILPRLGVDLGAGAGAEQAFFRVR